MSTKAICISEIKLDAPTQTRAAINQDRVDDYAELIDKLPAIVVYFDGESYWLADGWHRIKAALQAKKEEILADVRPGMMRDAVFYALGANAIHDASGLPRSRADKRAAVSIMLTDPEWSQWANNQIAKQCRVSEGLVRSMDHLRINEAPDGEKERKTEQGGKVVIMKTGKIGKKKRTSADEKLSRMTGGKALEAIKAAEAVCNCPCSACKGCKNKHKKA